MSTDVKPAPSGRRWPVAPGDWHHAPDHLVALVAALCAPPPRPGPTGEPTPTQWYAQVRRVVDQIWSTAWLAGTADIIAQLPPPPIVFTEPAPPAVVATAARKPQPPTVGPQSRAVRS